MSTANTLTALTLLTQLLERTAALGQLLRRSQSEGRDITEAELDQLRADDNAARAQLEQAIADARARQTGRARVGMLVALVALGAALAVPAFSAEPNTVTSPQINSPQPRTAVLSWTAPATYTDGTPITETISYNVYQGPCGGTLVKVLGPITVLTVTRTGLPTGCVGFQLTAQTPNGGESARSAEGSKTFPFPRPNTAPTLTVE